MTIEQQWSVKNSKTYSKIRSTDKTLYIWECGNGHEWENSKSNMSKGAQCPYCSGFLPIVGIDDLATTHPEVATQWDYTANNPTLPEQVRAGSSRKFWWTCEIGHGWEAQVGHRTKGTGCPYCSNKKTLPGYNDLATKLPEVAKTWNYSKNGTLTPQQVSPSSSKKVWWQCDLGHEWETAVDNRRAGTNCPYCIGKRVLAGYNDLGSLYPKLAEEWHSKNKLSPADITSGTTRSFWWKCSKEHEWEAPVSNRVRGTGCPYCSGRKVTVGINDITTTHPKLASQWNYNKNNKLSIFEISAGSNILVWWKCDINSKHEWETTPSARAGCPYCSGRIALKGINDITTTHPKLIEELDKDGNSHLDLEIVSAGSERMASWVCADNEEHRWNAIINSRTRGSGCPKCAAKSTSKQEKEVLDFVSSLGFKEVQENSRKVIAPLELDIYIPEKKIAIEYNGLYWHSVESGKDKNYHYNKWKMCQDIGVQLITVWEDDWRDRPNLVKQMLKHKLGVSDQKRVYARKTKFVQVLKDEAQLFLDNNHIQGFRSMSRNFGLRLSDGTLVAVASVSVRNKVVSLNRYATSHIVIGGMGKMLKGIMKTIDADIIETFADHEVSDGNLYELLGFKKVLDIRPDYKYVAHRLEREHKFNYRLKRFREDPNLIFEEGKTESELATLNKFYKIWDSGKTKFEYRRIN